MGDMNLTFDDGSVVRLHLTPGTGDAAARVEPPAGRPEADAPQDLPPGFGTAQPVSVQGRVAQTLSRGGEALAEALRPLGGVLDGIHQSFADIAQRPDEVTVEFGVTLGSDLSLGVFSGKGEASFTVSASWNFAGVAEPSALPDPPDAPDGAAAPAVS
ncbi:MULTISPECIES: CU044_2847 family protein [unclassified Streptomyces]|uniref:CU044_2847 family protein n=1 Tax=unclassified Streptomyces TaxID=2593676 RepID=UPI00379B82A3